MKYCARCGTQLIDEAVVCIGCGCSVEAPIPVRQTAAKDSTLATVIKVFMILGCIRQGWLIIPLLWCIPMTVSVFNALRDQRPISTGLKICTLLFVSQIGGICMLCMDEL